MLLDDLLGWSQQLWRDRLIAMPPSLQELYAEAKKMQLDKKMPWREPCKVQPNVPVCDCRGCESMAFCACCNHYLGMETSEEFCNECEQAGCQQDEEDEGMP